ncbi:DUF4145 domain-containing protein [Sutcliffiella sp. NC1]|uniref:DUF4145 domain-containing protein n=1 Tax=Sutcliffiella sp. NC1 TaxID=3004096 RepID=UPI0022DD46D4|nr:DUF4145 domain-containing protein [Sutcliffiella sp. NC1]WBL16436.1 DUF4145 domain-containing protein [Sutcliffiella sp. NC1]
MTAKEKVITCHHCGNKTLMKEVANHKNVENEELFQGGKYVHTYVITTIKEWHLYLCPVCINVTLECKSSFSEEIDYDGSPIIHKELLYPYKTIEENFIPEKVARAYEAALKIRLIDGHICAIAIRRTLEMMCKDKGEEGKNLYLMLKSLSEKGILPPILNDMASVLREFGNAAAHADEEEISLDLIPSLLEFTQIILDYVYNLPKRIDLIQDKLGKKREEKRHQQNNEVLDHIVD